MVTWRCREIYLCFTKKRNNKGKTTTFQLLQKASVLRELRFILWSNLGDLHQGLPPFSPAFLFLTYSIQTPVLTCGSQGVTGSRDVCYVAWKSKHYPQISKHQDTLTNPNCIITGTGTAALILFPPEASWRTPCTAPSHCSGGSQLC